MKILLGEIQPDCGEVKLGSNLIIAKFDQMREQLNLESSTQGVNIQHGMLLRTTLQESQSFLVMIRKQQMMKIQNT